MTPTAGIVVALNGVTSSGKSTLAAALLDEFDEPWTVMAIDQFHRSRARKPLSDASREIVVRRTVRGFHRAVAAFASVGNNVVVDHLLGEPWRFEDWLVSMSSVPTYLIGVYCDTDVLEARERDRGNRQVGRAVSQLASIHAHGAYDMTVDTTRTPASVLASQVARHVAQQQPLAMARLRAEG